MLSDFADFVIEVTGGRSLCHLRGSIRVQGHSYVQIRDLREHQGCGVRMEMERVMERGSRSLMNETVAVWTRPHLRHTVVLFCSGEPQRKPQRVSSAALQAGVSPAKSSKHPFPCTAE